MTSGSKFQTEAVRQVSILYTHILEHSARNKYNNNLFINFARPYIINHDANPKKIVAKQEGILLIDIYQSIYGIYIIRFVYST